MRSSVMETAKDTNQVDETAQMLFNSFRSHKKRVAPMHQQRCSRPGFMSLINGVRKSTLYELNQLLGLVSEEYTHRKEHRPQKGDTVLFTDGDRQLSGLVIKVNRRSVTVLKQPSNIEMRVSFMDLLPQPKFD